MKRMTMALLGCLLSGMVLADELTPQVLDELNRDLEKSHFQQANPDISVVDMRLSFADGILFRTTQYQSRGEPETESMASWMLETMTQQVCQQLTPLLKGKFSNVAQIAATETVEFDNGQTASKTRICSNSAQ
ncbi:hypothetical protein BCU66_017460 [Vibrio sp. 10N.286.49.B1]|uniref:hypothetical protein n=1 Tax=unclassified Vibrio TaxID=2614977 RepID=UPI0010551B9F|nr:MULTISPECIES: hypothetical protein [unclassified Vibrio]